MLFDDGDPDCGCPTYLYDGGRRPTLAWQPLQVPARTAALFKVGTTAHVNDVEPGQTRSLACWSSSEPTTTQRSDSLCSDTADREEPLQACRRGARRQDGAHRLRNPAGQPLIYGCISRLVLDVNRDFSDVDSIVETADGAIVLPRFLAASATNPADAPYAGISRIDCLRVHERREAAADRKRARVPSRMFEEVNRRQPQQSVTSGQMIGGVVANQYDWRRRLGSFDCDRNLRNVGCLQAWRGDEMASWLNWLWTSA